MAQPYQDLQGNWFVAGRPMTAQDVALSQAAAANNAKAIQQQQQAPQPMAPAPQPTVAPQAQPQAVDPRIAAAQAAAQKKKQFGLNPIGASMDFLFGGK